MHGGIDLRRIAASAQDAEVFARDASHGMVPPDLALSGAVLDHAGKRVAAYDAAHNVAARNLSPKGAALDPAGVLPRNAAHEGAAALGHHRTLHRQLPHKGGLAQIAEQPLHGAILRQGKPPDGMPAALEASAENRNAGKIRPRKINVAFQNYGESLAVAVDAAVPGKGKEVFAGGNTQGPLRICVFALERKRDPCAGYRHAQKDQNADEPSDVFSHLPQPSSASCRISPPEETAA